MGGGRVSWSNLPEDLLTKIGECLDTRFDIIRFRGVCMRWRYLLPFPHRNWNLQLPLSESSNSRSSQFEACYIKVSTTMVRSTVCIINQYPVPSPISTPWLLKLEETKQGKLRIINPISDKPVKDLPTTFPKVLNLLDYPILQVSRGYTREHTFRGYNLPQRGPEHAPSVSRSKVVILPESDRITLADDFMFLTLCHSGVLLLGRNGDMDLMPIDEDAFLYDDITVYRGHFVAVDRRGIVSFVDSTSSKLMQLTPPLLNGGQKKHLVVSSGHLYAVDRHYDRPRATHNPYGTQNRFSKEDAAVVSLKVYKLDEDCGWIEITSLDDRILFIGEGLNFFVPTKELTGCRGNYIFFIDEKHWNHDEEDAHIGSTSNGIAVFDLVDQRVGKLSSFPGCSDMLWPPPSWFSTTN